MKAAFAAIATAAVSMMAAGQTRAVAPIDASRIIKDVQVLASDDFEGRAPASRGEMRTVEYLIRRFSEARLEPAGDVTGGKRSWTQRVPLVLSEMEGDFSARIDLASSRINLRQGEEISVHTSHLPGTRVSVQSAPLVFVGYGVSAPELGYDDYADIDTKKGSPPRFALSKSVAIRARASST